VIGLCRTQMMDAKTPFSEWGWRLPFSFLVFLLRLLGLDPSR
jgi:hypothetical protein